MGSEMGHMVLRITCSAKPPPPPTVSFPVSWFCSLTYRCWSLLQPRRRYSMLRVALDSRRGTIPSSCVLVPEPQLAYFSVGRPPILRPISTSSPYLPRPLITSCSGRLSPGTHSVDGCTVPQGSSPIPVPSSNIPRPTLRTAKRNPTCALPASPPLIASSPALRAVCGVGPQSAAGSPHMYPPVPGVLQYKKANTHMHTPDQLNSDRDARTRRTRPFKSTAFFRG